MDRSKYTDRKSYKFLYRMSNGMPVTAFPTRRKAGRFFVNLCCSSIQPTESATVAVIYVNSSLVLPYYPPFHEANKGRFAKCIILSANVTTIPRIVSSATSSGPYLGLLCRTACCGNFPAPGHVATASSSSVACEVLHQGDAESAFPGNSRIQHETGSAGVYS